MSGKNSSDPMLDAALAVGETAAISRATAKSAEVPSSMVITKPVTCWGRAHVEDQRPAGDRDNRRHRGEATSSGTRTVDTSRPTSLDINFESVRLSCAMREVIRHSPRG